MAKKKPGKKKKSASIDQKVQTSNRRFLRPIFPITFSAWALKQLTIFWEDPLKRIKLYLGMVVSILTIIVLALTIPRLLEDNVRPTISQYYGVVQYENGDPVAHAEIRIESSSESGELIGKGSTQPNGQFSIVVQAAPETPVWVTITKDGEVGFADMQVLAGNKRLTFWKKP